MKSVDSRPTRSKGVGVSVVPRFGENWSWIQDGPFHPVREQWEARFRFRPGLRWLLGVSNNKQSRGTAEAAKTMRLRSPKQTEDQSECALEGR